MTAATPVLAKATIVPLSDEHGRERPAASQREFASGSERMNTSGSVCEVSGGAVVTPPDGTANGAVVTPSPWLAVTR